MHPSIRLIEITRADNVKIRIPKPYRNLPDKATTVRCFPAFPLLIESACNVHVLRPRFIHRTKNGYQCAKQVPATIRHNGISCKISDVKNTFAEVIFEAWLHRYNELFRLTLPIGSQPSSRLSVYVSFPLDAEGYRFWWTQYNFFFSIYILIFTTLLNNDSFFMRKFVKL